MAQTGTRTTSSPRGANGADGSDDRGQTRQPLNAVMDGARDAADAARQTAERAAARLPDAVAGAQTYARDTQRALNGMDDQALVAGAAFSLGLGVGLFVSGAHRLLVAAALVPAGAMAMTLFGRERATD